MLVEDSATFTNVGLGGVPHDGVLGHHFLERGYIIIIYFFPCRAFVFRSGNMRSEP